MTAAPDLRYDPLMLYESHQHIGGRTNQEDSLLVLPERRVFAVADGMGGHEHGEVASRMAVDAIARVFGRVDDRQGRHGKVKQTLDLAAQEANADIRAQWPDQGRRSRPGTTLTALAFEPGWGLSPFRAYIAQSGDSRCYLLRDGKLHQVTTDHSYQGMLTKCLGMDDVAYADLLGLTWRPGDRYMLCTDGVHGALPEQVIANLLMTSDPAKQLVDAALHFGTTDNCTAIVVRV